MLVHKKNISCNVVRMGEVFLGIDFGSKRIGVACSDIQGTMAFPVGIIRAGGAASRDVVDIAKARNAHTVVIGKSQDFKMADNPIAKSAEALGKLLEEEGLTVVYEPEFLTSHQAHHIQGKTEKLDASAAAIILQSFLDRRNNPVV